MKTRITSLLISFLLSFHFQLSFSQNIPEIPDFLDPEDLKNIDCKCLEKEVKYSKEDQRYIDILWGESLKYLNAFVIALTTTPEGSNCIDSDVATYETVDGFKKMCIMDRRDMQLMVKHIYQILHNPETAKKCFAARKEVDWIYSPSKELEEKSEVAQWLDRMTFEEFFNTKVTNQEVMEYGLDFSKNFYEMITGDGIKTPPNFPYDVSAKALPNLWAGVGWNPMYAEDSERNKRNFLNVRGGYAYAEILGHWGLLRIDEINGEKVGAEVGMVVQAVNTLYPYHNHAISELYYTMRQPACTNQFKTFAIRENNDKLVTVKETKDERIVQFDAGMPNEHTMWSSSSYDRDPLVYFHENTIHAFEVDGNCEAKPAEGALVTIWARSDAHESLNDYGSTRLCECADKPNTPAVRGKKIQCQLTKLKH
ncbi:cupin domain-containing protein [Sediminitomix flava]|uniref:Dimethylsulfoniopropionate lyase DddY n=1 Tax=Sediminitomix flava TaxID=379075 RepID=A0A315ZB81_SEDFL|nr:dimethylsulfonioproprionate lyase family protein [Sediminitomix flava]PWJ42419.1 dimethylsulfoniopropionate lyase DddY [Sediminitomix flava]